MTFAYRVDSVSAMSDRKAPPTTVLDPLRPAVVVRRRVYDAAAQKEDEQPPQVISAGADDEDDESGPPSSINVGRALASLRADELQRVEELLRADEEAETVTKPASLRTPPAVPAAPTVRIGKTIPLSELAEKMGVPGNELPATLVARGFYALTAKTVLPRATARVIAGMFGWAVEEAPDQDEPVPAKSGRHSRISPKRKAKAKAKTSKAAKTTKPAGRRIAR